MEKTGIIHERGGAMRYCNRFLQCCSNRRPRYASKQLHLLLQETHAKLSTIPTGRSSCKRWANQAKESCGGWHSVKSCIQALIFLASLRKCHPLGSPRLETLLTLRMLFLQAQSFCPESRFSRSASALSHRSLAGRLPDLAIPADRVEVPKLRWSRHPQTSDGRFFRSEPRIL